MRTGGREWLLVTAVLVAGVALCALREWTQRADQGLYDVALQLWQRPAPQDIVIVAVDDDSLARIGRWPWRRAVHATLLNRLTEAGAKAVGLDIILTEPDVGNARSDASLAEALRRNGKVVLPVVQLTWGRGWIDEQKPIPLFANAAAGLGHAHVTLDSDGIARTVYLHEGLDVPGYPHFALALLRVAEPQRFRDEAAAAVADDARRVGVWRQRAPLRIPFAGGPGHVHQVPYAEVLRGALAPETFRDKIVIIGATGVGLGDDYPTPVSGGSRAMSGVEINANVLDALRRSIHIEIVRPATAALLSGLATLGILILLRLVSPRAGLLATFGALALIVVSAGAALRLAQLWVPPASALLGCVLAYPVWTWRRLEAAQRYLDAELQRLNSEPALWGRPASSPDKAADTLERSIAAVRAAAERSRDTRRFIIDTGDSLPVGVMVADLSRRVILANRRAAKLFGHAHGVALMGSDLAALLGTLQGPAGLDVGAMLGPGDAPPSRGRAELRSADGKVLLLEIAPCRNEQGLLLGHVVSLDDISELRAAQLGREEAMRFLSHDLRAPLSSIITLTESASDAHREPPHALLERVAWHARNSLKLADDMLRLARAEAADPRSFEPTDLQSVLAEAADEVWPLAAKRAVRMEQPPLLGEEETLVLGDVELLRRAFVNLLANAVRFSPEGGRIRLGLASRGSSWLVSVEDQGCGIAAENLPRLFSRYARFAPPGETDAQGTGLGLVIVKTVVERHGGSIEVASEPDRGTRFDVALPRLSAR